MEEKLSGTIVVRGARQNNLKNLDLEIPRSEEHTSELQSH